MDPTTCKVTLVHWGTKEVPTELPLVGILKVLSDRFGTDWIKYEHSTRSVGCEHCGHGTSSQTVFTLTKVTKGGHYV